MKTENIRSYRLRAHHLDQKVSFSGLTDAAGACGLQNSPPGAWESALFHRVEGCTLQQLRDAIYRDKILLQAWSFRGAPVVFPTSQSDIFLTPLLAEKGEEPWIYTMGITAALDYVRMSFEDLLSRTMKAAAYLNHHTVKSKEALDRTLADIIERELPEEKKKYWRAPSMYGCPDRQTVGDAAVSFLLRPCSFSSRVVFSERQGTSPTFTSFRNWTGHEPETVPDREKELVRKYLHCYGPATQTSFMGWLGCSRQQAVRLWNTVSDEMEPVKAGGKERYILSGDRDALVYAPAAGEKLVLLGAHDPYLDIKDREIILEDKSLQKIVWRTTANPGVVLKGGRIAGIWRSRAQKNSLEIRITLFETLAEGERKTLQNLAEEYAAFRCQKLKSCKLEIGIF
ncbi:winged helix DNA-binding domain-containing protein [Anaerolentibacter hominis]|uniref:winged helix DNA-binding domain-containing protein n=1 Tax=Anaerolentibacter hominis TaxID=3079009 RepID=UPI0031B8AD63